MLSAFIEDNFTIKDFFPNHDMTDYTNASNSFIWLGDFHRYLGAYDIANKYYKAGIINWKHIASKAGIKYLLGARLLGNLLKKRM